MQKVLFVGCKYCDADPAHGITNAEHYLWQTCPAEVQTFHFDAYALEGGTEGDKALFDKALDFKPDVLFLDWQCGSKHNPALETLRVINIELGIPVIAIWWDHIWKLHIQESERLQEFIDLNIVVDTGSFRTRVMEPNDYLFMWTPQNPSLYHPEKKTIPAAFIGRTQKPGRQEAIEALKSVKGFIQTGGQREAGLSKEDYASLYRKSGIVINFSQAKIEGFSQLVGHVFEAALSGCLLLEQKNPETAGLFIPGVDYVEWSTVPELVEKVEYYLKHPAKRRAIAKSGYEKAVKYYSAAAWWGKVFEALDRRLNGKKDYDLQLERLISQHGLDSRISYNMEGPGPHWQISLYILRRAYEAHKRGDKKAASSYKIDKSAGLDNEPDCLRALIAEYLKYRDLDSAIKYLREYIDRGLDNAKVLSAFLIRLTRLLNRLARDLARRKKTDIALVALDSVRSKDLDRMPFVKSLADTGVNFINAYSASVYTRPAIRAMFTGERLFENWQFKDHTYLIDYDKSDLLQTLKNNDWDIYNFSMFKFFGGYAKFPVKICKEEEGAWCGMFRVNECVKYSTGEYLWKYLCELADSKKNTFSMFLCEEFHLPMVGGYHETRPRILNRTEHYTSEPYDSGQLDVQAGECLKWLDRQIEFYFTARPRGTVLVVTADHGQMLGEHGHAGGGMVWYDEAMHVPLVVNGIGQQAVDGIYSTRHLGNALAEMIETGKFNTNVADYVVVQRDDIYDKKYNSGEFAENIGKKFLTAFIAKVSKDGKLIRTPDTKEFLTGDETENLIDDPGFAEKIEAFGG